MYPEDFIQEALSKVHFKGRKLVPEQKQKEHSRIGLLFVPQYQLSAVPNLK